MFKLRKTIIILLITLLMFVNELFANDSYVEVIRIDDFMDGGFSEYDQYISDHRPVALKINPTIMLQGDINADGEIDIIDIVSIVNLILDDNSEFNQIADINEDGFINVADIIELLNFILN